MRRGVVAFLAGAALAATPAAAAKPILGITGNIARFQAQTGQASTVRQAFLGWGQGQSYGSTFAALFQSFGPIPMMHLGLAGPGSRHGVITTAQIAAGRGDGYLAALSQAIAAWGKPIYVRPLAEMNNVGNAYSRDPAAYRKAFARIAVIVHGGSQLAARLAALHLPPYRGPALAENAFPRVRVVWSPLATRADAKPYWPGDRYVDVGGADIYKEPGSEPPWQQFEAIFSFVRAHHKPFSVPEWGLYHVDDPVFVQRMCGFLKTHATETEEFYESKPGSIFDLGDKPQSRSVYARCITPLAAPLPLWARQPA
jgi:Glycosyl hydrolase family 26